MRSLIVALFLVYTAVADDTPIMCIQANGGQPTACSGDQATATKCHKPTFSVLGGVANYDYGCGACPTNPANASCTDCDGSTDAACNTEWVLDADFHCYNYSYDADKKVFAREDDTTTCHRLDGTDILCNSPTASSTAAYTSNNGGCGPCADGLKDGVCTTCNTDSCNTAKPIMCVQAAGANATECAVTIPAPTKCLKPTFSVLGGVANYTWGCGACPETTPACIDCEGKTDAACNTAYVLDKDFQCYNYSYNTEKKVFAIKKDPITCHRLDGTKVHCNSPGVNATSTYTSNNSGCGSCAEDLKAGVCKACDADRCNSAVTATAFLLPLAALLYSLF